MNNSSEFRNTSIGNNGTVLFNKIKKHVPQFATLLLLGLGSGRDFHNLSKYYKVTGSDFSKLLLSVFQKSNPDADLISSDIVEINTERKFDLIYSNKVLHQMSENDLSLSLENQLKILTPGGYAIHSFWSGRKEENHHGLKWIYYNEEKLVDLIPLGFKVIEISTYKENLDHDSIYLILKKI